jgi:hypothetical protein
MICWIEDDVHVFDWPNYENLPPANGPEDVLGCGLLINPENRVAIFFTSHGMLMGQFILELTSQTWIIVYYELLL